jgi:AGZA family xanthine/uracil permease-like MFS transporter
MVERLFRLTENQTTFRTEILAGVTTFMTMAYILFVQPSVLSRDFAGNPTGLSPEAVLFATCVAAFLGCLLMGLLANYPIAQAPGMGENFFFVTVVMGLGAAGFSESWKVALGITLLAGLVFLLLCLLGFQSALLDAISPSLKNGIAVGIGLFICFIGLKSTGLVIESPGTAVRLNPNVTDPGILIFLLGLLAMAVLTSLHVRGAILWGIVTSATIALLAGQLEWHGVVGFPRDLALFSFDFGWMTRPGTYLTVLPYIVVFLFMDVFDTAGTLIGVGEQGGFIQENRLPRAKQALLSDAVATVAGSCLGTSTVTSYVESSAGVAYGGRTGLVTVTTGVLFLLALFFTPLARTLGEYPPITAPALFYVGCMMARNMRNIDWEDVTEAIPSFFIMTGIPFFHNISDGIAAGLVLYPILKLLAGKGRHLSVVHYVVALVFVLRYVFFPV